MPNELVYDRARGLCCAKCTEKFDCWIFKSQVQVVSDYNPLTFLTKGLKHGTKLAHWALALQRYDLQIIYCENSLIPVSKSYCSATSVAVYCGRRVHKDDLFAHCPERCIPLKIGHRCVYCPGRTCLSKTIFSVNYYP
ncbi:polyprotein of retroviral origin, putative [Trichonephila clavipes]|nr:polyprotein of retroviral origin, putative [Trichonephila clavipes]